MQGTTVVQYRLCRPGRSDLINRLFQFSLVSGSVPFYPNLTFVGDSMNAVGYQIICFNLSMLSCCEVPPDKRVMTMEIVRKNGKVVRTGGNGIAILAPSASMLLKLSVTTRLRFISHYGDLSALAIDFALVNIQALGFVDIQFKFLHLTKHLVHTSPE
jgi:hypothetical protein